MEFSFQDKGQVIAPDYFVTLIRLKSNGVLL